MMDRLHDAATASSYSSSMDDLTITGEISKIDDDKRQVFGWASVTEINGQPVVDLQNDYVDTYEIEKAAYEYVLNSRVGGEMHRRVKKDSPKQVGTLIESMVLTPEKIEKMGLPDETPRGWWIGFKVHDDEVWKAVKSDKYTGFSIHGVGKRIEKNFDEIGKAVKDRSEEEVRGWVNRMAETAGVEPKELVEDLSAYLDDEGITDPDDDDLHEFMVNTYGGGNVAPREREVGKHLIGSHKQKDHDPTKGKEKGNHARGEHKELRRDRDEKFTRANSMSMAIEDETSNDEDFESRLRSNPEYQRAATEFLNAREAYNPRGAKRREKREQSWSVQRPASLERILAGLSETPRPMPGGVAGPQTRQRPQDLMLNATPLHMRDENDPLRRLHEERARQRNVTKFLLAKAAHKATSRGEFLGYVDEIYKALGETAPAPAKAPEREPEQVGLSKSQIEVLEKYLGPISKKIEERDGKYVVLSESGKVLGTHETREKAQRQLAAVEANKDH